MFSKNILKILIFIKILKFIDTHKVGSVSPDDIEPIESFQILNPKYSSSLPDPFPIYFNLKLAAFNRSYSIIFSHISKPHDYLTDYTNYFRFYQSVQMNTTKDNGSVSIGSAYFANCILILNSEAYQSLKSNVTLLRSDPSKLFYLDLHIRKTRLNQTRELWVKVDLTSSDGIYRAIRALVSSKTYTENPRPKRSSKTHLNIESCVVINYEVYQAYAKMLKSQNKDYIKMYLDLYFAQTIDRIDSIYQQAVNDYFEISVQFVRLDIDFKFIDYYHSDKTHFLLKITETLSKRKDFSFNKCDHIFLIHNYALDATIGLAWVAQVCLNGKTSATLYAKHHFIELVMAHELGHNLGADHDINNYKLPSKKIIDCENLQNLMYVSSGYGESYFKISACSIDYIYDRLFNRSRLLDKFNCLIKKNFDQPNQKDVYLQPAKAYLPGYFLSLSEQCKYMMNNSRSFYCNGMHVGCTDMYCYNVDRATCDHLHVWALDGTVCGYTQVCFRMRCVEMKKKRAPSTLDLAVAKMRHYCPGGTSLENFVNRVYFSEANFNFTQPCKFILGEKYPDLSKKMIRAVTSVCCEEYYKIDNFKCDGIEGNCSQSICDTKPCFNNGKCVKINLNGRYTFECICKNGFSGPLCLKVDPCFFEPCQYGELCVTFGNDGYYVCMCPADNKNLSFCNQNLYFERDQFFFRPKSRIGSNLSLVGTGILCVFVSSTIFFQYFSIVLKFFYKIINNS